MNLENFWASNVPLPSYEDLTCELTIRNTAYSTFEEWNPDEKIHASSKSIP
jgi:hypothetical protein